METVRTSLSTALFSGVQQRLLGLFFGQPDRSYYTNELLRLTSTGRGGLLRELARMVAAGLVDVSVVGNQKHYKANRTAPIFDELRGIVRKTFGLADVLREALRSVQHKIVLGFVFGSFAKGTDTASSDVDLMIVGDGIGYTEIFDLLAGAEAVLGRKVNPTLYGMAEFKRKVSTENHFVTAVLAQPKIFLIGKEDDIPPGKPAQGK